MAQKVRVELVCDACQDERPAQRTITFGFEDEGAVRHEYQIELCSRHVVQFMKSFDEWIPMAREAPDNKPQKSKSPKRSTQGPARRDAEQLAGIRSWARANGYEVSDKGRIPGDIEEAYNRQSQAG